MQLTAPPAQVDDDGCGTLGPDAANRLSEAVRRYETRRCHLCQDGYPLFGFGPPLTRSGRTIWACGKHRSAVDRMLGEGRPAAPDALTRCSQARVQQKLQLPPRRAEANRVIPIPTQGSK